MQILDFSSGFRIPSALWTNTSIPLEYKCTNHKLYDLAYPKTDDDKEVPADLWTSPALSLTEKVTWVAIKHFVDAHGLCTMPLEDLSHFVILKDWKSVAPCISKLIALSFLDVVDMDGKECYFAHIPSEKPHPKADERRRSNEISYMYEVLQ